MSNLESRITRLEIRLRALRPAPLRTFQDYDQFHWATDPEEFRRAAAREPNGFRGMMSMEGIMNSPIPMKILRLVAFEQLRKEARQQK